MIVAVTMFAFSHSVQAQGTQGILNASQSMLGGTRTTQRRNLVVHEIDSIFDDVTALTTDCRADCAGLNPQRHSRDRC
jgi:hypothetical protein